MTYKEIVNRIQDVVNAHYMLADFGYGDLSDLKVRFENTSGNTQVQADYPYLFLNPATHTRTGAAVTYNFNMIVMDLARGEVSDQPYDNILSIQSQCQQYIDDVIAQLWNGYTDPPQVLWDSLSYNTFNERFQDDVAGMTVNLQIMVPQAINNCITPIDKRELLVTRRANAIHPLDFDGFPDGQDNFYEFREYSYDGLNWFYDLGFDPQVGSGYRSIIPLTTQNYKIEFDINCTFNEPEDLSGRLKYGIVIQKALQPPIASWFIDEPWYSDTTVVNLSHSFDVVLQAGQEYYFYVGQNYAAQPAANIIGYQLIDSTYKVYGL